MAEVTLGDVTIAYDVFGAGEPVVLVCGCGEPAWAGSSKWRRPWRRRVTRW